MLRLNLLFGPIALEEKGLLGELIMFLLAGFSAVFSLLLANHTAKLILLTATIALCLIGEDEKPERRQKIDGRWLEKIRSMAEQGVSSLATQSLEGPEPYWEREVQREL